MEADKKKKKPAVVKDYVNLSTETNIHITVQFEKGKKQELMETKDANEIDGIEKLLKLTTTVNTNNMNMFNAQKQLHKYANVQEIIESFYEVRIHIYQKRKNAMVRSMKQIVKEMSNKARFIQEIIAGSLDLRTYEDDLQTTEALQEKQYDKVDDKYEYLTRMPMHNMNKSRVHKLMSERDQVAQELEILEKTECTSMWLRELELLESKYKEYVEQRKKAMDSSPPSTKTTKTNKTTKNKTK